MLAENETPYTFNDCDEPKMFKIYKSSNEGESGSLVYKILRTTCRSSTENFVSPESDDSHPNLEDILQNSVSLSPSGFLPEDNKLLSFDSGISPEDEIPENYSNIEIPYSLPIKSESYTVSEKTEKSQELRRSSRLQAIQSRLNVSHDATKEEKKQNAISDSEGLEHKRRRVINARQRKRPSSYKQPLAKAKEIRRKKRDRSCTSGVQKLPISGEGKCQKRSACSSATSKDKTERTFAKSGRPSTSADPRLMNLKSMLLIPHTRSSVPPVPSYPGRQEILFPKFANVNTSRVLSTLYQCRNSPEFTSFQKPIALFFTKNLLASEANPKQNGNHQYYFQKMQKDIFYLRKKYQLLDLATLDNCYGKVITLKTRFKLN